MSNKELLQLQAAATRELRKREVVRTRNNPLGDYTEWLVSSALGLRLEGNSKAGFDAVCPAGNRFQIKGRRVTPTSKSRQLSAIRKYSDQDFDDLVAVIFDENFEIVDALLIPHAVVGDYARFRAHVNAHILMLKGPILTDVRVRCIKSDLCNWQSSG